MPKTELLFQQKRGDNTCLIYGKFGLKNKMIANLFLFLSSVIFISLSGVMMPGPVLAVTIAKAQNEKYAGISISFGHGAIEIPLMILIYLGFSKYFASTAIKTGIGLIGGIMLIFMGIQLIKARIGANLTNNIKLPYNSFVAGLITTGANPYFFIWWATVGTTLILTASTFGLIGFLLFAIVHWSCDLVWNLFVSIATFKSKKLWSERTYKIVFGICSALLIGFGFWFILNAVKFI